MSSLEVHKREKNPALIWNAAGYYDHPDGEDLLGKLSFVCKHTTVLGILLGVLDANQPPKTNNVGKLLRIARCALPAAAMGFTFTSVTYCSTILRGEDDGFNHALGGVAAGLLLGPASGVKGFSLVGALLCGSVVCLYKNLCMRGYDINKSPPQRHYGSYYSRLLDSSKLPEIKGNWTRDP